MLLHVYPGCRVVVDPRIAVAGDTPFEAKVVRVKRRYGRHNHGQTKTNPLVAVVTDEGEEKHFDLSLVTQILNRPRVFPGRPENVFAEATRERSFDYMLVGHKKGTWCGPLKHMVEHVLAQLHQHFPTPVDYNKLEQLFEKQKPGLLVPVMHGMVQVRRKPFEAWVRRNARRLCKTIAQVDDEQTDQNVEWEADMEADLLDLFDLDLDFLDPHQDERLMMNANAGLAEDEDLMPSHLCEFDELDDPIGTIGLTVRASRSLEAAGISTVFQLLDRSAEQLFGIKGIGPETVKQIRELLEKDDLYLLGERQCK